MKKAIFFSFLVATLLSILITGCGKKVFKSEDTTILSNSQSAIDSDSSKLTNTSTLAPTPMNTPVLTPKPTSSSTLVPTKTVAPENEITQFKSSKTINFSTFDINKKYYNSVDGYVELKLSLPRLDGNYDGIPEINRFFVSKEKFFYDELPLETLKNNNIKVAGERDNWYRRADYKLEAVFGDIISISADLNGGAGGVGWPGKEGDVFNLNTGQKLSLGDIFKASKDEYMNYIYDFVSKKIMAEINNAKQKGYSSGFDFDDAYSGKGYTRIRDSFDPRNFYLTKSALVVFYPQHALRGGPTGPLIFQIPLESILNILAIEVKP